MKRNMAVVLAIMIFAVLAGCGNKADVESAETAEDTVTVTETEETEDEEPETSYYTGYNHYINPKEAGKEAEPGTGEAGKEAEPGTEEAGKEAEPETGEEAKADSQTQENISETAAEPIPSAPDRSQLEEWMPPINMLVICDANVVDENGNVLGPIEKGSDIGVTGQCPGYYQVNYGAKRSFLPKSALAGR